MAEILLFSNSGVPVGRSINAAKIKASWGLVQEEFTDRIIWCETDQHFYIWSERKWTMVSETVAMRFIFNLL